MYSFESVRTLSVYYKVPVHCVGILYGLVMFHLRMQGQCLTQYKTVGRRAVPFCITGIYHADPEL